MALNKKSRKWKDEEGKKLPGVYDNQERRLREFRKIKELPYKANKWTGKLKNYKKAVSKVY